MWSFPCPACAPSPSERWIQVTPGLTQSTNQGVLCACGEAFPRKHWHTGNHACQEGLQQKKEPRNKTRKSCWLGFPSDPQKRWCQQ